MSSNRHNTAAVIVALLATLATTACAKKQLAESADARPSTASQPAVDEKSSEKARGESRTGAEKGASEKGSNGSRQNRQPPAVVITAPVREAVFATEVEALGTAKANEAIDVAVKVSNRVTAIRFREGQAVKQGDVLVELDADEAKAELAGAEAALGDSRSQVNRARELAVTKALSTQQMEQLEATLRTNEAKVSAARARLNDLTIRAPFAGRVGLRNVSVGSIVNSGTIITTLDDISVMKLDFSVPETFLPMLNDGLEVEATSSAYSGDKFKGRILSIDSRVDPISRSITVRAQIANRDMKLKPGMFMTVRLVRNDNKALVIPEQALVPERDKQYVFAVRDGKAVKTEIVVGRRRPGEVEVLRGLRAGDVIVSEGTQKIRDGGTVRVAGTGGE